MFTGIVKETGLVKKIARTGTKTVLAIDAKTLSHEVSLSDSVAVNGVCLTVTRKENQILFFDAVETTLAKTNLKNLKLNEAVNLEPALKVGDNLGGHFVLGHIDCTARIKKVINRGQYWKTEIDFPPKFKKYALESGSIAVEGVSLTLKKVLARSFTVDIIPFTYLHTTLKNKHPGALVNLEFDYLLKAKSLGGDSELW